MAHLTYSSYAGYGETAKKDLHYSQAVKVGDHIHCSGQGGWIRDPMSFPATLAEEVAQAFANVEHTLQQAGGAGWRQVYSMRTYYMESLDEQMLDLIVAQTRRYCPDHQPIWTTVGVRKLGDPRMSIEVEVSAHLG